MQIVQRECQSPQHTHTQRGGGDPQKEEEKSFAAVHEYLMVDFRLIMNFANFFASLPLQFLLHV